MATVVPATLVAAHPNLSRRIPHIPSHLPLRPSPTFPDPKRPFGTDKCIKPPSRAPSPRLVVRAQSSPDYLPDAKFYKVEAIVRPWRVTHISRGLLKMGIRGVTISDVRGFGAQGGSFERHAGSEFTEDKFVAKTKIEIVVCKEQVESVIEKITVEARTGEIGDGKIFVTPVSDVIRIRTGERGEIAEKMAGGRADMMSSSASSN